MLKQTPMFWQGYQNLWTNYLLLILHLSWDKIRLRWPRELNALQIEKKHLQIKKTTSSIWQHMRRKYSQHNQTKNQAANKIIYLIALWAFAVCFFIWLCCEHL